METSLTPDEVSSLLDQTEQKKNPYENCVPILANGILKNFEPPVVKVAHQLHDLGNKQQHLVDEIHRENLSLCEVQHSDELQEIFVKMKLYLTKLQNSKKDLRLLHEKSTKLKKRALRLQQAIEKEEYTRKVLEPKTETSSSIT